MARSWLCPLPMMRRWADALATDIRFGLRALRGHRRGTLVSVMTLATALGVNSAILSLADAILLKPLPYPQPSRIVMVTAQSAPGEPIPEAEIFVAIGSTRAFESWGSASEVSFNVTVAGQARRVQGAWVTPSLFAVLRLAPAAGRVLTAGDTRPGAEPVAMISARVWRSMFQAAPSAVGASVIVDGINRRIVGVAPETLDVPEFADVLLPGTTAGGDAFARLASDVGPEAARTELSAVIAVNRPSARAIVTVQSLSEARAAEVGPIVILLIGAVALVLLVACANVSGIQIARATIRRSEMGIRAALGASRARLAQQIVTEQVLVALAGGSLGLIFATWGVAAMAASFPVAVPVWLRLQIDGPVVMLTIALTLGAGLLCAVAPALQAAGVDFQDALKVGGRGGTPAASRWRTRLVAAEVALTVVLLVGAGLLMRTTDRLSRMDVGADLTAARTMELTLPAASYPQANDRTQFARRLLDGVTGLPRLVAVGVTVDEPYSVLTVGGGSPIPGVRVRAASPGYFAALGVRLIRGRVLTEAGGAEAVISSEFAKRAWPGEDALGRPLSLGRDGPPFSVVGIVSDVREPGMHATGIDAPSAPAVYVPLTNQPAATLTMIVRGTSDEAASDIAADVERRLSAMDPDVPLYNQRSLADAVLLPVWPIQAMARALALVALISVVFAAAGVYGVTDQIVMARMREMGIRTALGASSVDLLRLLVGQATRPALLGAVVGLVAARAGTPMLASLVYGIAMTDPITYIAVVAVLAGAIAAGTLVPAHAITQVQPADALRAE